MGAVSGGLGTVQENPTLSIPMVNLMHGKYKSFGFIEIIFRPGSVDAVHMFFMVISHSTNAVLIFAPLPDISMTQN